MFTTSAQLNVALICEPADTCKAIDGLQMVLATL